MGNSQGSKKIQITETQVVEEIPPVNLSEKAPNKPQTPREAFINFHDGRYTGDLKNGMRHGQGKHIYNDGSTYEGAWHLDQYHGYGTLVYRNEIDRYEGNW